MQVSCHTHFSLNHYSYVMSLMLFFKLYHHDLTEIIPKRKLGQGNKLNDIKLNRKHELPFSYFEMHKVQLLYH